MEKKILTHSIHNPVFNCYETVEAEYVKNNPGNKSPVFRLFSSKCKSDACFVKEYPCQID